MKKTVIAVASGKGGTGKTTVASCLALSAPGPVQFLDCDVEEPNAHIFLKPDFNKSEKVSLDVPVIDPDKCTYCGKCAEICVYNALAVIPGNVLTFPELCHGCGGCRVLCPEKAVTGTPKEIGVLDSGPAGEIDFIRGLLTVGTATTPPVIKAVKKRISDRGIIILDAPPGTSCPVVATVEQSDFVLLVTEPTAMGLNDLALALEVVRQINVPCGVIINRCTEVYHKIETFCREKDVPVLLKIPVDREIARAYSVGIPPVKVNPDLRTHLRGVLDYIEGVTSG